MCYYRYKATIAYDGYNYYGFERQGDLPTIELSLINAFKAWLNKDIKIVGSGRTDKHVHALGQVIHFDLDNKMDVNIIKKALNSFLPIDIKIVEVKEVDKDFHARFSATKKEYIYLVNKKENDVFKARYSYYVYNLDISVIKEAISYLIGKHNFRSFSSIHTNQLKDFNREIYDISIIEEDDLIKFSFLGSGFLKYQVRRMMGLLIEIGKYRYDPSYIKEVLDKEDPRVCQYIVPGEGLYLNKVYY